MHPRWFCYAAVLAAVRALWPGAKRPHRKTFPERWRFSNNTKPLTKVPRESFLIKGAWSKCEMIRDSAAGRRSITGNVGFRQPVMVE